MIITTPRVAAAVAMPNSKDEVGRVSMPTTRLLPVLGIVRDAGSLLWEHIVRRMYISSWGGVEGVELSV